MKLTELRSRIDGIDSEILRLLAERCELTHEIGRHKKSAGTDVWVPEREQEVLDRLLRAPRGHLTERGLRAVFRQILSAGRETQGGLTVAVHGGDVSAALEQAKFFFGECTDYIMCGNIEAVLEALRNGQAHLALCDDNVESEEFSKKHSFTTADGQKFCIMAKAA